MKRTYDFITDIGYMTIWENIQENTVNNLKVISLTMPDMIQTFV